MSDHYKILHIPTGMYLKETCLFYLHPVGSTFSDTWDTSEHTLEKACKNLRPGGSTLYMFDKSIPTNLSEFLRIDITDPIITEEDEYSDLYNKDQIECLYYLDNDLDGKII